MEIIKQACKKLNLDILNFKDDNFVLIKKNNENFFLSKNSLDLNSSASAAIIENKTLAYRFFKHFKIFYVPNFSISHPNDTLRDSSSFIQAFNFLGEFTNGVTLKWKQNLILANSIDQIERAIFHLFKQNADKIFLAPFLNILHEWRLVVYNNKIYSCFRKKSKRNSWVFTCDEVIKEGDLMLISNHLKPIALNAMRVTKLKCFTIDIIQIEKDEKSLAFCDDFGFLIFDIVSYPISFFENENKIEFWTDVLNDRFKPKTLKLTFKTSF